MIGRIAVGVACASQLGACATAEPIPVRGDIPVRGETPGATCSEAGLDQFVGREATSDLGAQMLRLSGAAILRWVPHGTVITMEYRSDRLTVYLDSNGRIERISCS